ncbi:MAG: hypothetical protein JSW49_06645 [candidate division WOR-3 bacterium]|nr:MAG: hypothetical protein JSW49_06645 [candidate division WOR-3 bacterium]
MKKILILFMPLVFLATFHCGGEEEPFFSHVYGNTQRIRVINDSIPIYDTLSGVNGMVLRIYDIDPYNLSTFRLRYDTTENRDTIPGCFEMDSVCYGTTRNQGNIVSIAIDSTENPGWTTQYHSPFISGDVDTITVYFFE